jgi:crotonobetaine/carnitine-CoA ligase
MPLTIAHGRTINRELEEGVQSHPDKPWLIFQPVDGAPLTLTYREFAEQVYRTANALRALDIRPGDRLLLVLGNCPEFLYLWFGAARMGAIIVPVNPLSSDAELEYLASHSEAAMVAVHTTDIARGERLGLRHLVICGDNVDDRRSFSQLLANASSEPPAVAELSRDDVAILYTSGTTSRPKGCLITHANYIHAGEAVAQHAGIRHEDRHLVVLPYFHGNAQYYSTMSALVTGATVVFTDRFSASRFWHVAAQHQATVLSLFAAPMRMLLAQPEGPLPEHQLRLAFFAQSVTSTQLDEWQRRFGVPLLQIYGMTEQLGWPMANPLHGHRDNMSIGRPTLPFRCRVVDEAGEDVAAGTAGQLLVHGTPGLSLMRGYYRNAEATADAIRDGWLSTGDNVREREDGLFDFIDRAKDMIKRAGENVAASEVEAVLKEHPAVFDVAVIGVPDAVRDEAIKAYVVLREDCSATQDELIGWCASRLARFRVPELLEFRSELPRTSVGKIQKHILRAEHASAIRP